MIARPLPEPTYRIGIAGMLTVPSIKPLQQVLVLIALLRREANNASNALPSGTGRQTLLMKFSVWKEAATRAVDLVYFHWRFSVSSCC